MAIKNFNEYVSGFSNEAAQRRSRSSASPSYSQPVRSSLGYPRTEEATDPSPVRTYEEYQSDLSKSARPVSEEFYNQISQSTLGKRENEAERADKFSGQEIAQKGLTSDYEEKERAQALQRWFRDQGLSTVSQFMSTSGPVEEFKQDTKKLADEGMARTEDMQARADQEFGRIRPALNKFVADTEQKRTDAIAYGETVAENVMANIGDWATQDLVLSGVALWQDTEERIRQGRAALSGQSSEGEIDEWEAGIRGQARQKAGLITAQIKSSYLQARAHSATQLGGWVMENAQRANYNESQDKQFALDREQSLVSLRSNMDAVIENQKREYALLDAQSHQAALTALSHGYDSMFKAFWDADAYMDPMGSDLMIWANEVSSMYGPPGESTTFSSSSGSPRSDYPEVGERTASINDDYGDTFMTTNRSTGSARDFDSSLGFTV